MTSYNLKVIAIITMLIDHFAAVLIPNHFPIHTVLRGIGRISFPIFAFLIVEGYFHTSNFKKYLIRMGIFALLSEIPFNLAFYKQVSYAGHQNIFFTLFLGLLLIYLADKVKAKYEQRMLIYYSLNSLLLIVFSVIAIMLRTDYQFIGILMIFVFFYYRGKNIELTFVLLALTLSLMGWLAALGTLAMVFIWHYNGEKGKSIKYMFYIFYPTHLLILYLIYTVIYSII